MSVLSVAPISYENSITKKELPLNIFQGKFPIAIKREVSIRIYNIRTTKNNKEEHGWGIRNIVATLEKYDAEYIIDYKNGEFVFSIMM